MSEHELSSSQTQYTVHREQSAEYRNSYQPEVIERCLKFIVDFRKNKITKGTAVLGIQQELEAVSDTTDSSYTEGFAHYLEILNSVTKEVEPEKRNGSPRSSCTEERESSEISFSESTKRKRRGRATSEEIESFREEEDQVKFYPWLNPTKFRFLSRSQGTRETLECYEEWSDDPKFYCTKVVTTLGCPSLTTSQWTLLLEGKAVDLHQEIHTFLDVPLCGLIYT
ncbi:hypothetical protein BDR07DRAFT_1488810 [Suillus spraguei]|nr:hypothetical protein BDR07DRAFT_1488810 [Suillus spraguei]